MGRKKYVQHTPKTKKALTKVVERNGKLVHIYVDTGLPIISSTAEYMHNVENAVIPHTDCRYCGKSTDAISSLCYECRELNKDLEMKMKRIAKVTREQVKEGTVTETDKGLVPDKFGVTDASWKPYADTPVIEEAYRTCSKCYIVLPRDFGRKRLCEDCRK